MLVRIISMETNKIYKNRDLFIIFKRLLNKNIENNQKNVNIDKVTKKMFIDVIGKGNK